METCEDCRFRDKLDCAYRPPVTFVNSSTYTTKDRYGSLNKGIIDTSNTVLHLRPIIGETKSREVKTEYGWEDKDVEIFIKACVFHRVRV